MMKPDKIASILLAALGCIFIAVSFWIADSSKVTRLLYQYVSRDQILEQAQQVYRKSEFSDYVLKRKIDLNVDASLLRYAQLSFDENKLTEFLPIGRWEIVWKGERYAKKEGKQDIGLTLTYDFKGRLIGLEQTDPNLNKPPNFKESEALTEARKFLNSLGIDTSTISLRNKIINKEERTLHYDFLFTKPSPVSSDLRENYHLKISGRNITSYRARTTIDTDVFCFPESENKFETAAIVSTMVVWALLGIVVIGTFFKRLKHDAVEFKRAFWLGAVACLMMWTYVALEAWPGWEGVLLGGGFSGIFTGIGVLVVYSVAESLNREMWRQKVALTDTLFRGFFRVKELGMAILNALFISGLTLLIFAAIFFFTAKLNIGRLALDESVLWIFKGNSALLGNILQTLLSSLFIGVALFSFWPTYLRSRSQNTVLLIVLFGIFINLAGLHLYYLRPSHLAFLLFIPIAALWAYFGLKFDFISIFLSLFIVNFFLELALISLLPDGLLSTPAIFAAVLIGVMLLSGSYLVHSRVSIEDFKAYVPAYVNRIAERERFLKELEIARQVQMTFLPQSVPKFANLDIACICRPAMEVGGDYYDFICNGSDSLGVVLGDVSGKGVSAAFYMTMVKGIVKTLTKTTHAPKQILTDMNAIFYENAPKETFISMIYGLFDVKNKKLVFARAGHNPIIVRKCSESEPEMLNSKGLAIGLDQGQIFATTIEELSIPIEPGDVFVFFTDGITESMNKHGEEFGEERLSNVISRAAEHSAQTVLDQITHDVSAFSSKTTQHDDFTMVVVKVGGPNGRNGPPEN